MVSKRNRIVVLVDYFESLGIEVNIGKNKARGNKGYFKAKSGRYRIDIAKTLSDEIVFKTLLHEFAHFIHFSYDNSLTSLDFFFEDLSDEMMEEMIKITVETIPKTSVVPLFETKDLLKQEIKSLEDSLSIIYSNYKLDSLFQSLENQIKKMSIRYLLSHDNVKILYGIGEKCYSISSIEKDYPDLPEEIAVYLRLKSKKRALKRINSKISRLNKYYNSLTELFARSIETFISDPKLFSAKAPFLNDYFYMVQRTCKIPLFTKLCELCLYNS